jgi:chromosome segregation ATPase
LNVKEDRREQIEQELAELRRELEELEASLPKHSIKSSQLMRIEDLEDAIAEKEAALSRLD